MGSKRASKSFEGPGNLKFEKPLKNIGFTKFLKVQSHHRQARKAKERSQEAPEEFQKPKKGRSKNRQQIYIFLKDFFGHFGVHLVVKSCSKRGPK